MTPLAWILATIAAVGLLLALGVARAAGASSRLEEETYGDECWCVPCRRQRFPHDYQPRHCTEGSTS